MTCRLVWTFFSIFCLVVPLVGCGGSQTGDNAPCVIAGAVDVGGDDQGSRLTGGGDLFVVAWSLDGRPVAVQRVSSLGFPADFCLSSGNVLEVTGQLPEQILLSSELWPTGSGKSTYTRDWVPPTFLFKQSNSPPTGNSAQPRLGKPLAFGTVGTVSQPIVLGAQDVSIRLIAAGSGQRMVGSSDSPHPPLMNSRIESQGGSVSGTVSLAVPLSDVGRGTDVLYIIARNATGRLLAVSKPYRNPRFPVKYEMSNKTVMMGGIPEGEEIVLLARLDRDGDAFSSPGDVEGEYRHPVRMGDRNVDIVLDRTVQ